MNVVKMAILASVSLFATCFPILAADAPIVPVHVDSFVMVDHAPVRDGFAPFSIEAIALLPAPRKRDSFTPTDDELFHPLRRTVERFLQRKEIARGWSHSNQASLNFGDEIARFPGADGLAYAIEGELVVHGETLVPLGLRLSAPPGVLLRYAVGIFAADQEVMVHEGVLDETTRKAEWMVKLRPNGPDAALPIRAAFAVRAEGGSDEDRRRVLASVSAAMISSSDGRLAVAERASDASEWLKPLPMFLKPEQVRDPALEKGGKSPKAAKEKKEKKAEGGGHN
ncbi:hypothetical protein [Magnetospirillum molischianum]|uniref:Uncharacterized protein n=1 Tax=Magnetospirillum molischianum DSM 120 TaxID=1150626 RepID=H8FRF2_MAGML|nr:hypothetical protein [Magnetospirillum molischianum]CCG40940.1 conserved exported hypothetical protein [Magnetospirillum molischianum DSM 120]